MDTLVPIFLLDSIFTMRKDITTSSFEYFATLLLLSIAMLFANPIVIKGQESDSVVVVSSFDGLYIYPFISDERIILLVNQFGEKIPAVYPLLIVNNIVFNDKTVVDHFRNSITLKDIKKWKIISKMRACKKGINNPPEDGVLMVTLKRKHFFEVYRAPEVNTENNF